MTIIIINKLLYNLNILNLYEYINILIYQTYMRNCKSLTDQHSDIYLTIILLPNVKYRSSNTDKTRSKQTKMGQTR